MPEPAQRPSEHARPQSVATGIGCRRAAGRSVLTGLLCDECDLHDAVSFVIATTRTSKIAKEVGKPGNDGPSHQREAFHAGTLRDHAVAAWGSACVVGTVTAAIMSQDERAQTWGPIMGAAGRGLAGRQAGRQGCQRAPLPAGRPDRLPARR